MPFPCTIVSFKWYFFLHMLGCTYLDLWVTAVLPVAYLFSNIVGLTNCSVGQVLLTCNLPDVSLSTDLHLILIKLLYCHHPINNAAKQQLDSCKLNVPDAQFKMLATQASYIKSQFNFYQSQCSVI